jgi:hypothetical protein
MELVKAAKNMEMAATATQTPVSDFSARTAAALIVGNLRRRGQSSGGHFRLSLSAPDPFRAKSA